MQSTLAEPEHPAANLTRTQLWQVSGMLVMPSTWCRTHAKCGSSYDTSSAERASSICFKDVGSTSRKLAKYERGG